MASTWRNSNFWRSGQTWRGTGSTGPQTITCTGFDSLEWGGNEIDIRIHILQPSGIAMEAWGTAEMGGGVRWMYAQGADSAVFGGATVSLFERELFPFWWVDTYFGSAMLGYHRNVAPSGWDSFVLGDLAVRDNRQYAAPAGINAMVMATEAFIAYGTRPIHAPPVEPGDFDRWGHATLRNDHQYIAPEYAFGRWIEPGFGDEQIMAIRNKNREVDLVHNGIPPVFRGVSQGAEIRNVARILAPAGLDATVWGNNLVAFYIRTVTAEGFEAFQLDHLNNVYNAADLMRPFGFSSSAFGSPTIVNTRRFLTYCGVGETDAIGLPFIAPAIRTLTQAALLEPVGGLIGGATVWPRVRPVTPIAPAFGYGGFFGTAALDIHHNIVQPNSVTPIDGVSPGAAVRNVTPQLHPYWDTSLFTRWGTANVFNQHEDYDIQGWADLVFGLHTIDYRTQHRQMNGFNAFRPNNLHRIRNVNPDPPGQQYIDFPTVGYTLAFGDTVMSSTGASPAGIDSLRFGSAIVRANQLHPRGIGQPLDPVTGTQMGVPALNGAQFISVPTLGFLEQMGIPDFSPRTIWAPQGAPDQAKANHPPGAEEQMDAYLDYANLSRPLFGRVTVELKNRTMQAIGEDQFAFGMPGLSVRPIHVDVVGIKATKYGFPSLNGGGGVRTYSINALAAYGTPTVTAVEPFLRYLRPDSLPVGIFGLPDVANFHREIDIPGLDALLHGQTIVQRPPPPAEPAGLVSLIFGPETFIAYRIRNLPVEGDDFLDMDYAIGHFADRLRVHGVNMPLVGMGDQLELGTPTLESGIREVAPPSFPEIDMPVPTVRKRNRVNVSGLSALLFGETWSLPVTPGEIQPRGDDWAEFGMAALARTLHVDSAFMGPEYDFDTGTGEFVPADRWFGAAAVAQRIGAHGADTAQFGVPTAIGFGCGARARLILGLDQLLFGLPGVANLDVEEGRG